MSNLPTDCSSADDNWARQALSLMDEAEAAVRWAAVSMPDVAKYEKAASAFWAVAHLLAKERDRLETANPASAKP